MLPVSVGKREIGIFAVEVAAFAGERDHIFRIHHVLFVLHVHLADAWFVGMSGNGVVGDANGNPYSALFGSLADHLHYPDLILVGYRERFTARSITVSVHKVAHRGHSLAGCLAALEGNLYKRTVVDHRFAGGVL